MAASKSDTLCPEGIGSGGRRRCIWDEMADEVASGAGELTSGSTDSSWSVARLVWPRLYVVARRVHDFDLTARPRRTPSRGSGWRQETGCPKGQSPTAAVAWNVSLSDLQAASGKMARASDGIGNSHLISLSRAIVVRADNRTSTYPPRLWDFGITRAANPRDSRWIWPDPSQRHRTSSLRTCGAETVNVSFVHPL